MRKWIDRSDRILENVVVLLMGLLVLDVTWQVATRYLLNTPSSVTEEIARYLLIWIGLLGATLAYKRGLHLAFDMFSRNRSASYYLFLHRFGHVLVGFFAVSVLAYGGMNLVLMTYELGQTSASLGIRLAYIYAALPISGMLMTIYSIDFIIQGPPPEKGVA
jgi:TRAP-type C4-dicarboxylate transport system permease small subunit